MKRLYFEGIPRDLPLDCPQRLTRSGIKVQTAVCHDTGVAVGDEAAG